MRRSRPLLRGVRLRLSAAVLGAFCLLPCSSVAQSSGIGVESLRLPGSEGERNLRLRVLLGLEPADGLLMRNLATGIAGLRAGSDTIIALAPEFSLSHQTAHPWGGNDGPLRAGRGNNLLASIGLALRVGPVTAVFLPQYASEANLLFQTFQYSPLLTPRRSDWANPFYKPNNSADYPLRFGTEPRRLLDAQGRLSVDVASAARVGVARETRWWGPGLQNALLLSNNAPAIEQFFVESPSPIVTRLGRFEYQYLLGRLNESEFFDFNDANDRRSLSAAVLTWTPPERLSEWPTLGIARGVIANRDASLATALDVLRNVGRPWSRPADSTSGREQITSVFAQWMVPDAGVEAYAEWVRFELPGTLREFLEQPGHAQGYTLGVQWASPQLGGTLQLASEFSYVEPSPSARVRPIRTSYTSLAVKQGWTHEGQMLGPWIGPAASSQWLAADLHLPRWRAGATLGRMRRDANYRFVEPFPFKREDVQLYAGARLGYTLGPVQALVEYTSGVRLNHLFQSRDIFLPEGGAVTEGIDLLNRSYSVTLTTRLPRVIR